MFHRNVLQVQDYEFRNDYCSTSTQLFEVGTSPVPRTGCHDLQRCFEAESDATPLNTEVADAEFPVLWPISKYLYEDKNPFSGCLRKSPMSIIRDLRQRLNSRLFDKWELGAPKTPRFVH